MPQEGDDEQGLLPPVGSARISTRQNETPKEFMERLPVAFTEPVDDFVMRALFPGNRQELAELSPAESLQQQREANAIRTMGRAHLGVVPLPTNDDPFEQPQLNF